MILSSLTLSIELTCFVIAFFSLRKEGSNFSYLTISYLALVFLVESISWIITTCYHYNNAWLYNISIIFEVAYVTFGLYLNLKLLTKLAKTMAMTSCLIFLTSYLIETSASGFLRFNIITITIISVIFVLQSLYYYFLLIRQKEAIVLRHHPQFWWVAAVLFYYFGGTIYNLFASVLLKNRIGSFDALAYTMLFLNIILYSTWSYSFLCRYRQHSLSQS